VKRGKKIKGPSARGAGRKLLFKKGAKLRTVDCGESFAVRPGKIATVTTDYFEGDDYVHVAWPAGTRQEPGGYLLSRFERRPVSVKPRASRTRGEGRAKCR
jgi:hypothetical protein